MRLSVSSGVHWLLIRKNVKVGIIIKQQKTLVIHAVINTTVKNHKCKILHGLFFQLLTEKVHNVETGHQNPAPARQRQEEKEVPSLATIISLVHHCNEGHLPKKD